MANATPNAPTSADLAAQIDALKADIGSLTATIGEMGKASGMRAADAAKDQVARIGEAAQHSLESTRAQAAQLEARTADYVAQNPAKALGIAVGLGFLIGMMSARR